MNKDKLISYVLIFLGIYLFFTFFLNPNKNTPTPENLNPIRLEATKKDYSIGDTVKVAIKNTSSGSIIFTPQTCPRPPLSVFAGEKELSFDTAYKCDDTMVIIQQNSEYLVSFDNWNNDLFTTEGAYKVSFTTTVENEKKTYDTTINIRQSNWFGNIWDTVIYRPIYNALIFLTTIIPGNDLGWAIIVLTLLIRIILLIPNQRALEQQKNLQKIQPKIKEIQEKYTGNQQKIGEETMKLWKEHKVNPLGSCLPMLLQLPILIGLYYAIQNGLNVGSTYFLYEPLRHINIQSINSMFLGILDLSKANVIVLPIIIGILQFLQMKLSFQAKKKKESKEPRKEEKKKDKTMDPSAMMGKSMTYVFPFLIAFMTASFPAGVGLYWGISTLFGILQQIWVNKEKKIP